MNGTHKFAVDTQILRGILERGCIYIDKTALVYKMTHELKYVFLSRPRRFGKSLLCNTLKEYFDGNKELFKGLQIDALEATAE
ncbi:MAG: AAA family ATPase [Bacteroidales bacterium]|nr:AAA family ATPase [Bacteroidales bacterium]